MTPQSSRTEPHFHFAVERVPTSWKSEPVLRGGFTFFATKKIFQKIATFFAIKCRPKAPPQNRTSISRWNEFQLHGSPNLCYALGLHFF